MLDKFIDDKLYPLVKKLETKLRRRKKDMARKLVDDLLHRNIQVMDDVERLGFGDTKESFSLIDRRLMKLLGEIENG
jgi:hypothetical protein